MNLREFFKDHKIAIIIFVLAVVVRLALFFAYLSYHEGDFIATIRGADGYFEISENLIHGNGYSDDLPPLYAPNSLRPPAWIITMAFIAKLFGSYIPVFIFQLILSALTPLLGMYLAGKIISSKYVPLVGLALALEPATIYSNTMVVSETSFTFLFLMFVVFLFRYFDNQTTRNIIWSAVFIGLAILVKPTVQFFPVLIPLGLIFIYRKNLSPALFRHAAYFVLVSMLVLAPWIFRNYKEFGTYGLTSQAAYNLYTVLVPTIISIDSGTTYEAEQKVYADILRARGESITPTNGDKYTSESVSILSRHKMAFVKSMAISVVTFFTHDHMLTVLGYGGIVVPNILEKPALVLLFTDPMELISDIFVYAGTPGVLVLLGRLVWIAIALLFFSGVWLYCRREKFSPFALAALLMVAYFAIMTAANGFGMNGRFRIPVNTFIFTFAVYGFIWARELTKKFTPSHA